ncbi:peptidoglycan D,D-transpeptidase FtsI family protein [Micropruina sp.]|uniref:peptidoglycan D,D-transpeptidase FtsI family protein n=1 Tax=Micropruina sp. TaxID=2737536 RepID=UPI0039E66700
MNRPIRRVALVAMLMTLALLVNVCVSYLVRQESLNANPQNRRVTDAAFAQDRGAILVGNTAIAETVASKDQFKFQRRYPQGDLYAGVTGFFSYNYGSSELEQSYGSQLSGNDDSQFVNRLIDLATGATPSGASVQTTLNAKAQQAAADALGSQKGAVVALNPSTGAILAMVTSPTFDPNDLATHTLTDATAAWNKLTGDTKNRPMANRAVREIFPPGSTFKVIVSAAALEAGYEPDSVLNTSSYKLPGTTTTIGTTCGDSQTLKRALELSCNSAFARLGVKLGADALREQAEKFGFGTKPLADITSVASRFPDEIDVPQTGLASIGGYDVAATPLQMAMVAAAVRNDGVVMQPYLVESVRSDDLQLLSQTRPSQLSLATSSANAAKLRQMMVGVVENGTGWRAQVSGVTVGGKTGTANSDNVRTPYAWFIAWADDPEVAICVFVQDAEMPNTDVAGGRVAAPIAKAVIEALR